MSAVSDLPLDDLPVELTVARHSDLRHVQLAGFVPDANGNGVDDLLDIRTGTSRDGNGDGVPDEAQVQ